MRTPGRLALISRDRRRSLGFAEAETGQGSGVSPQWLSVFENGETSLGVRRMRRLLDALGLSFALRPRPRTVAGSVLVAASNAG